MAQKRVKKHKVKLVSNAAPAASQSGDKQQHRHNTILALLQQSGSVLVEKLSAKLAVSVVTIRRDLDMLEQQGMLSRTHGGAVSIDPLFYEPFKNDRSFLAQVQHLSHEKRRIGRAAAALINVGETIAITPGTTTAEVVRGLPLNSSLTVVTNTVNIAMELSKRKDVKVFVTGGHLHGDWFSLIGPTAVRSLENILIQTIFLGADGFDAKWGISCDSTEEAEVNTAMMRKARRRIAVADHSKLGLVAQWRICDPQEIHTLVTDTGATDAMIKPFRRAGIEVIRA